MHFSIVATVFCLAWSLVAACGSSQGKAPIDVGVMDSATVVADTTAVADTATMAKDAGVALDGAGCSYGGRTYAQGDSFPMDECNSCYCSPPNIACTARICREDAAVTICSLPTMLTFWYDGGMRLYTEAAVVTDTLSVTRTYVIPVDGGAVRGCTKALPACGTAGQIDLGDIATDYAAADVMSAFVLPDPTVFGVDPRAYDGSLFAIKNVAGKTIYVGADCPSPTTGSCRPVPAGVKALATDLQALFDFAKSSTACAGL